MGVRQKNRLGKWYSGSSLQCLAASESFAEYGNFVRAVICSRVRNKAEAEDLFEDVFLSLVFKPVPLGIKDIKNYLYRAIVNDIIDTTRRLEAYKTYVDKYGMDLRDYMDTSGPETALTAEEVNNLLTFAGRRLKSKEYQALTLHYRDQHSIKETAKIMGVHEGTAKRYVSVAITKSRRFLIAKRESSYGIDATSEVKEEKVEADVDFLGDEKEEIQEEKKWPTYLFEDFEKIAENVRGLENAGEDKSRILYHIMEIEAFLGRIEKKAGATGREAEARLAASLRDICRVHEPSELSNEQIKCFTGSLRSLTEGWGELNREKVKWIRKRLLEVGLTWLPVTKKAEKDIAEAKKVAGIDEP